MTRQRNGQGQTALVTGASMGIGVDLAECFAQDGYDLILTARSEAALKKVAERLAAAHNVKATAIPVDLGLPGGGAKLAAEVAARGGVVERGGRQQCARVWLVPGSDDEPVLRACRHRQDTARAHRRADELGRRRAPRLRRVGGQPASGDHRHAQPAGRDARAVHAAPHAPRHGAQSAVAGVTGNWKTVNWKLLTGFYGVSQ